MGKVLTGIGHLHELMAALRPARWMLVRDASYPYLPDTVKAACGAYADTCVVFDGFTPNPLYEDVAKGVGLYRDSGCEAIVAIGGGSAMDVAKCIKLYARMDQSRCYLEQEMSDPGIPLIAIPTTAGTGSESTRHAVIYYEGKKQSVSHPCIIPDYALLEPAVLKSLPLYQKKCTMLDALCQGIESWWSVNSTPESIGYARCAVEGIMAHWRAYIEDNDPAAAEQIMLAANAAGQAINITATTAPHAMSYKLTSLYHLPHGHAVAICLLPVWEYMLAHTASCTDPRGAAHLADTLAAIAGVISPEGFAALLCRLDMAYPQANARAEEIALLTASVNPVRLKNSPVPLPDSVLRDIYERIVK